MIKAYHPLRTLGRGGFGEVWLAEDQQDKRTIALKVLSFDAGDPDLLHRFDREARVTSALDHPNIVRVYAHGVAEGRAWIAYEFLPGGDLTSLQTRASADQARRWGQGLAGALATAHAHGVIHRDVKPANILRRADDQAVLADFGIARSSRSGTMITPQGLVLGTPAYMAPETILGGMPTPASDQFALAATLLHVMTGKVPYGAVTIGGCLRAVREQAPPQIDATIVPPDLVQTLGRALSRDPQHRFVDLHSFQQALVTEALPSDVTQHVAPITATGPTTPVALPTGFFLKARTRTLALSASWLVLVAGAAIYGTYQPLQPSVSPSPLAPVAESDELLLRLQARTRDLAANHPPGFDFDRRTTRSHADEVLEPLEGLRTIRGLRQWLAAAVAWRSKNRLNDPTTIGKLLPEWRVFHHVTSDLALLRTWSANFPVVYSDHSMPEARRRVLARYQDSGALIDDLGRELSRSLTAEKLSDDLITTAWAGSLSFVTASPENVARTERFFRRLQRSLHEIPAGLETALWGITRDLFALGPKSGWPRHRRRKFLDKVLDIGGVGADPRERALSIGFLLVPFLEECGTGIAPVEDEELVTLRRGLAELRRFAPDPTALRTLVNSDKNTVSARKIREIRQHTLLRKIASALFVYQGD